MRRATAMSSNLQIDRADLLLALSSHDLEHYLDLQTGLIIPVLEDSIYDEREFPLEEEPERYHLIDPVPSQQGFRWMQDFAQQQEDLQIREDLLQALDRRRPFRSFKDALESYPEIRVKWFAFEEERLLEYGREWLSSEGITANLVVPAAPAR
jgi:hypothetical protein